MKRSATLLAGAIVSLVAEMGIATGSNGAFAQSHATHNLQSGKPPIFDGGATARAFDIQNRTIQNGTTRILDGWIYRSQTDTYYNPRTGVTCTGKAASAPCF
jgi:hypothetical protein